MELPPFTSLWGNSQNKTLKLKLPMAKASRPRKARSSAPRRARPVRNRIVIRSPVKVSVPRPPRRDTFTEWLRLAKTHPFDVKPPPLGIRGESSSIFCMTYRCSYTQAAAATLKFVVKPYASSLFSATATDFGADVLVTTAASGLATISGLFGAARPICGGFRVRMTGPTTSSWGVVQSTQQPTSKLLASWFQAGNPPTAASINIAATSWPTPIVPLAPGQVHTQLWSQEDLEDTQLDADLVNLNGTFNVNNHPAPCGCVYGHGVGTTVFLETKFWMEGAYNDTVANIFGVETANYVRNPSVLLDCERKSYPTTTDTNECGFACQASNMASAAASVAVPATRAFRAVQDAYYGGGTSSHKL